ncbi:hypothetical protein IT575_00870 [bacterium]|nr:hypothetical protein [bacterium]
MRVLLLILLAGLFTVSGPDIAARAEDSVSASESADSAGAEQANAAADPQASWLDELAARMLISRGAPPGPQGEPVLEIRASGPVYLKSLDDPANPYRDEYSPFDRWAHQHQIYPSRDELSAFSGTRSPEGQAIRSSYPEGYELYHCQTDAQGFQIPYTRMMTRFERNVEGEQLGDVLLKGWFGFYDSEAQREEYASRAQFYAGGVAPAELLTQREELLWEKRAALYPPVPVWLGQNPPLYSIFVPHGEILCYGPLGLEVTGIPGRSGGQNYVYLLEPCGELWYRYSADGKLLGKYDLGSYSIYPDWRVIYWPGAGEVLGGFINQRTAQTNRQRYQHSNSYGYAAILDYGEQGHGYQADGSEARPQSLAGLWDFDGKVVDPATRLSAQRQYCGNNLDRDTIRRLHKAQLALGIVSADSHSPYAGTAEGPVIAQGPRPWQPIATGRDRSRGFFLDPVCAEAVERPRDWVLVRALDDPANPYRGQYRAWDHWAYQNAHRMVPDEPIDWQKYQERYKELQILAAREKRELSREEHEELQGYMSNKAPEDWQRLTVYVDKDGWPLPLNQKRMNVYAEPDPSLDLRETSWLSRSFDDLFHFDAGGVMEPALLEEYGRENLRAVLRTMPPIPDWLMQSAVRDAIFMPNGDVITWGPLGSWDPDAEKENKERKLANWADTYYRYNSAGELQSSLPRMAGPLSALYNLGMVQVYETASTLGYEASGGPGVLIYRDKESKQIISAWDWQGNAVDFSQPIHPVPGCSRRFEWDYLWNLYQQQLQDSKPTAAAQEQTK